MSRYKKYIEANVVEEAAKRLDYIYDHFDTVVVMFSGGKDSLVTLHLAKEAAERAGRLPLDVIFLDEEVIPPAVVRFVKEYRDLDWCRLHWFAVPMQLSKTVLGTVENVVAWEQGRGYMHEAPEYAIRLKPGDKRVFTQQTMDQYVSDVMGYRGLAVHLQGIRADESITRYRSCVNKLHDNWINHSTIKSVKLAKPIYDWRQPDIFKWLRDEDIKWCDAYQMQYGAGQQMRVATPLHGESARQFDKLYQCDPAYMDRIRELWPEMDIVGRYRPQYDPRAEEASYTDGMAGCWRYIHGKLSGKKKEQAIKIYYEYAQLHRRDPVAYPVPNLLRHIVRGVVHRTPPSDTRSRMARRERLGMKREGNRV